MLPSIPPGVRKAGRFATSLLLGVLGCELLLRILVPFPIYYSTWYTSGVHTQDDQFGFVFQPHYQGVMRHADKTWYEPLELDQRGFRLPAIRTNRDGAPTQIVMLGGQSMAFSYGLPDAECIHQQVADRLDRNCNIEVLSWSGFPLDKDLAKLKRFTTPEDFDVAVVFAYNAVDYQPKSDRKAPVTPNDIPMVNSVVSPMDPAASIGGPWYYRSYTIAGICRLLRLPARAMQRLGLVATETPAASAVTDHNASTAKEPRVFTTARRLQELGIDQVIVVALPIAGERVGPPTLPRSPADEIVVLDLRDALSKDQASDWIASGHYGPRSAQRIAQAIATSIESHSLNQ